MVPAVFPFPVSNFSETQLPARSIAMNFNCGITTLTSAANGTVTWGNNCSGNPTPSGVQVGGTQKSALVYLDGLTVATGATLRLEGELPIIIAVRGDASIAGAVSINSIKKNTPAAGANHECGAATGGNGGVGGSGATHRGGGGAGAGFGSTGGHARLL